MPSGFKIEPIRLFYWDIWPGNVGHVDNVFSVDGKFDRVLALLFLVIARLMPSLPIANSR